MRRALSVSVGLGLLTVVHSIPAGQHKKKALAAGGATCAELQGKCSGYNNIMMFCCEQAEGRKENDAMCTRFAENAVICGGAEHMESTMQSCCASEWAGGASLQDIRVRKQKLGVHGVIGDEQEDAPIMVVGDDGQMEEYDNEKEKHEEAKAAKAAAPPKAVKAAEPMARKAGTCKAKSGHDWAEWCDKNCLSAKYGGLGDGACKKGDDTGAVGCICDAKYGKPITVVKYDEMAEKAKEKAAAKVEKDRLAKEAKEAAAAAAAADAAVYHPKDSESCKSRVASTPDYWCIDMCKGEGGCPKTSCACDGDDPNVPAPPMKADIRLKAAARKQGKHLAKPKAVHR
jgi:hypothetical protein